MIACDPQNMLSLTLISEFIQGVTVPSPDL
jgi:hypothetical protein